jgi:multidrug efflux pump subunit AcrB
MVRAALGRPITVMVLFGSLLLAAIVAMFGIPIDIFPKLNAPTIYVIEQYGGMAANQMEGFFATRMQEQLLYVNGIKSIETKSIQGLTLLRMDFYENANMAEASANVATQVSRMMALFPPGSLPPVVVRFDASSLPVGELVFSSSTRSLADIFDLAMTRVRPLFATVPGLSTAPPFGSNARSVLVNVDPNKLRMYGVSADEVVDAIARNNSITPSGNVWIGDTMYVASVNSLESTVKEFEDIPVKSNGSASLFIHDLATVADGSDLTVSYALVNGKRSVYIPVVKSAEASTLNVVRGLRERLPEMKSLLPDDVGVQYEFDQSVFVINAAKSLLTEGILGAILTGLMVFIFLRDWRSSVVVAVTIPVSVLGAVFFLRLAGQTINIMTLSGLALAIGILVDQATVTIENIHQHLEMGKSSRQAILDACTEISFPLLLILLCILAVFAPAFVMTGIPKAMFLPLSLSIAFAMIVSFVAAQTAVPVLANWLVRADRFQYRHNQPHAHAGLALDAGERGEVDAHLAMDTARPEENDLLQRLKTALIARLGRWMPRRRAIIAGYLVTAVGAAGICFMVIGKDLLPISNNGELQMRLREPDGTRLESTERMTKEVLGVLDSVSGHHVEITSAFVGVVPTNFGHSNLYIFNSGSHEAVIQVALSKENRMTVEEVKEKLRDAIHHRFPDVLLSFEPIELTEKILAEGAATALEVRVAGKSFPDIERHANAVLREMSAIPFLRDVQIAQPTHLPTVNIAVDRAKLALMGLSIDAVARSITASTSSSRYTSKNFWLDQGSSYTYQTQVEVPEYLMSSMLELRSTPLVKGQARPVLGDVATLTVEPMPGEYDRSGPRRYLTINAGIHNTDLASATKAVEKAVARAGTPPTGTVVQIRGMSSLLTETLSSLQTGLVAAIVVILLLLAANYQSFGLSVAVLATVPAVLVGSMLFLLATGSTLNLQSYMGIIMSTGVSVANAILIVTNAEALRLEYRDALKAAIVSAGIRLRPILMTSLAMIAGMIPMASGLGEGGDQVAPLGRAVIGGLVASTFAALVIVPLVYAGIQQGKGFESVSLLPEGSK